MKRVLLVLLTLLALCGRVEAAVFVAAGNINLSGNWLTTDATGNNYVVPTTTPALSTGNTDSSTFVLGASQVEGMAVWLASRANGSPSNTITVILRNSTTSTNTCSVTANVSDLPTANTTEGNGGWFHLKCASAFTPNGTDSYLIRATLSSTSTAVSLYASSGNNFERLVVRTATGTPSTGDDMFVQGVFDGASNPATTATVTLTNDNTATTDFGSASTNQAVAALVISNRGTFAYGTATSTNYYLKLSGWIRIANGGVFSMGASGAEIPRSSTAVLEFDCSADGDFGVLVNDGGTFYSFGLSRTSGKNVIWTLLTANLAASGTSATVADDTGWLNGDVLAIAPTARTFSQGETVTLNADATSSGLAWTTGTTNAHLGQATDKAQAEVILLTRNVMIRSASTTGMSRITEDNGATIDIEWTDIRYLGYGGLSALGAVNSNLTTSGSIALAYDTIRDADGTALSFGDLATTGVYSVQHVTMWNIDTQNVSNASIFSPQVGTGPGPGTLSDIVVIVNHACGGSTGCFGTINTPWLSATITNIRISGGSVAFGFTCNNASVNCSGATIDGLVAHSNSGSGLNLFSGQNNVTYRNVTMWRNGGAGFDTQSTQASNFSIEHGLFFGNTTSNINIGNGSNLIGFHAVDLKMYGDTSFATTNGLNIPGGGVGITLVGRIDGCDFGTSNGSLYTTHTNDIVLNGFDQIQLTLSNCKLASTTEVSGTMNPGATGFIAYQNHDLTAGDNFVQYPHGRVSQNVATVHSPATTSEKMTPTAAFSYLKLVSGTKLTAVNNTHGATPCVWMQKDGSYNGNAPRLMQAANPAVGVNSDTVLATSVLSSSGSWFQVCGASAAFTDNGVGTWFVDVDGTAGNVYIGDWSVTIN